MTYLHYLSIVCSDKGNGFTLVFNDTQGSGELIVSGGFCIRLHGILTPDPQGILFQKTPPPMFQWNFEFFTLASDLDRRHMSPLITSSSLVAVAQRLH